MNKSIFYISFKQVAYQKRHKKKPLFQTAPYWKIAPYSACNLQPRKIASPSRNSISIHAGLHAMIVLYPFIDHVALSATIQYQRAVG
jgi:hypothetical protein